MDGWISFDAAIHLLRAAHDREVAYLRHQVQPQREAYLELPNEDISVVAPEEPRPSCQVTRFFEGNTLRVGGLGVLRDSLGAEAERPLVGDDHQLGISSRGRLKASALPAPPIPPPSPHHEEHPKRISALLSSDYDSAQSMQAMSETNSMFSRLSVDDMAGQIQRRVGGGSLHSRPLVSSEGALARRYRRQSWPEEDVCFSEPNLAMGREMSDTTLENWSRIVTSLIGLSQTNQATVKQPRYRLQPIFALRSEENGVKTAPYVSVPRKATGFDENLESDCVHIHVNKSNAFQCLVAHPTSMRCTFVGILACVSFLVDAVIAPLQVCDLSSETQDNLNLGTKVTLACWVLDLVAHFFNGYEAGLFTELRPGPVALHYLTTWFIPDLVLIGVDIAYIIVKVDSAAARSPKAGSDLLRVNRVLRFSRLVKLLRIHGVKANMSNILQQVNAEYLRLIFQLSLLLLIILLLAHWVACGWIVLGDEQTEETWMSIATFETTHFEHRYAASLHWALAQFTPATTNVSPHTFEERIFAICIVALAMLVFSSFISNMTTLFNAMRNLGMKEHQERTLLRWYLRERKISPDLGHHIQRLVRLHKEHANVQMLKAEEVPGLSALPPSLKVRLCVEICQPHFAKNPALMHLGRMDRGAMREVCHAAIREIVVMPLQDIFEESAEARHAFCIVSGHCRYSIPKNALHLRGSEVQLSAMDPWLSDLAMFIKWNHVGRVSAMTVGQMLELSVDSFHAILCRFGGALFHSMRIFAVLLLQHVEALKGQSVGVNDMMLPKDHYDEIITRSTALQRLRSKVLLLGMDPTAARLSAASPASSCSSPSTSKRSTGRTARSMPFVVRGVDSWPVYEGVWEPGRDDDGEPLAMQKTSSPGQQ